MDAGLYLFGANSVALTASLLIGAGVLIANPRSFNARLFAGVTLSSACYLLGRASYAVPPDVQIHFWFWPYLLVAMNLAPGLWMMLAYRLFEDGRRIPRWMVAAFAVQAVLSGVNALAYIGRDSSALLSPANPGAVRLVFGPLPIAMQAAFALLALFWAVRGWRADLDEERRMLRGVFLAGVGGLLFGVSVAELLLLDAPHAARTPFDNAITLALAAGYVTVALAVLRFDGRAMERLAARAAPGRLEESQAESDRRLAALTRALEVEKIYLTPGLSIGDLAGRLAMPEYRLRALIKTRLGYRNFNALLHEHRLRDACGRLADPANAHLPILTIALDVGYRSITPFNQAFRDAMGCTPSEYRRRAAAS